MPIRTDNNAILIYTAIEGPRLHYTLSQCLPNSHITTNQFDWLNHQGPRIWYHDTPPPALGLHIYPTTDQIWEIGTLPSVPTPVLSNDKSQDGQPILILYPTAGHLGYDPLAAIFYMLSCAAEYDPDQTTLIATTTNQTDFKDYLDEHNRFRGNPKLKRLYKNILPPAELWAGQMLDGLHALGYIIEQPEPLPCLKLSVDIDNWFAFRTKPLVKQLGGMVRDLFTLGPIAIWTRLQTLMNGDDPFAPEKTLRLLANHQVDVFILNAQTNAEYDKNIKLTAELLTELKSFNHVNIGMHPSYQGNQADWATEKHDLETKLGRPITINRFHYLHFRITKHYRGLIDLGIEADHSFMFANTPGWRAGTSKPFNWYDLEADTTTKLMVHPYLTMDTRLVELYKRQPKEAANWLINTYITPLKAAGLSVPLVLHNESLSDYGVWSGWSGFLQHLLAADKG